MIYDSPQHPDTATDETSDQTVYQLLIIAKADFAVDGMVSLLEKYQQKYMVSVLDPEHYGLEQVLSLCPDVLLLNTNATTAPIDDYIHEVHSVCKTTNVLLFGQGMDDNYLYTALRAGAKGYLNEKMRGDHLTTALDTVLNDGYWAERHILCRFISDKSAHDKIESNVTAMSQRLTNRESEVLELILEGMTTNEIADRICLSHQGVKAHLTNLFRKFEVKNRSQLILTVLDEISPVQDFSDLVEKGLQTYRKDMLANVKRVA